MTWWRRSGAAARCRDACLALVGLAVGIAAAAAPEAVQLNEMGVGLTARGQYPEAARAFERALRLSPDDPVIRRNAARLQTVLGHRHLAAGQTEAARQAYAAAIGLAPDEAAAHLGLGDLRLRARDPRGATESYRRAVALQPGSAIGYARLGEAHYQLGDAAAALDEWRRALELDPGDAGLRKRVAEVERAARVERGYRSGESQHFRVTYEGERRSGLGHELLGILERAYVDVGYELGAYPDHAVQTIFYTDRDFVEATGASTGIGGFYHLLDGKIRIALGGLQPGDPRLRSLLYHEYTHALIYAVARGNNPPRWVHEGLAVRMEGERGERLRAQAVREARAGRAVSLEGSPYVHGTAAVALLVERHGMAGMRGLLQRLGEGRGFPAAFRETFGVELDTFRGLLQGELERRD